MGSGHRRWRGPIDGPAGEILLLGVLAAVVGVGGYLAARPDQVADLVRGGWALLGAGVGALAWRHRYPRAVLGVTLLVAVAYYKLGFPAGPEPAPFLVALYHATSVGRRTLAVAAAAASVATIELTEVLSSAPPETTDLVVVGTVLLAAIAFGEFSRSRRDYLHEVEQRALDAERTREAEASRRVAEERLRIARELHDSLGHQLTVVNMHAGAALLRRASRPELAYQALDTIKSASHEALQELRHTVQVLRNDKPAPSLDQLPDLARRTEAAGTAVTTRLVGKPRSLPAAVEHAAYRIVQEALTNVTRHAAAGAVDISLCYEPDQLIVQIDDDGRGPRRARRGGNGLTGMRERAAAVGGQLVAGPRDGGGFRVYARLPMQGVV